MASQRSGDPLVTIPQSFIDKLEPLGPHFIRVAKQGKEPIDKGWTKTENMMRAQDPTLHKWLGEGGNYGVAGGGGLVILDADTKEIKQLILDKLPRTFTVQSPGSSGWHCYYLCGLEKPIRLRDKNGENVGDIQGPGKQAVGPSAIHPNGSPYKIIKDVPFARVTKDQLVEALKPFVIPEKEVSAIEQAAEMEKSKTNIDLSITTVVPLAGLHRRGHEYYGSHPSHGSETGRNFWVNSSKNCWHCFRHGTGGGPFSWLAVEEGIINCEDAVPGALRGPIFKKVLDIAIDRGFIDRDKLEKGKGAFGNSKLSQADRLTLLCLGEKPILFHDQHNTPYARIKQDSIDVTLPIRSRPFKTWLANLLWEAEEKAPGTEAVYGAMNVLEAKSLFEGEEHILYNRVAPAPDGIWIDMADDKWRAIKVTAEGWNIVDDPPILFKRFSHQKPLVNPKCGGDPWKFLEFINLSRTDHDATSLVLLVAVITYLIPGIPHVILVLYGIQGSGKTSVFKLIRSLIDPSAVDVLSLPRKERERVQQLDHHWCAFYDNIARLPVDASDTFCRASTGGGFTKRELYTDNSDIIYNFKRCVGLSGINIAAQRGDLLDRSLLVGLHNISVDQRKTEAELFGEFERHKAEILGGFLDTLVESLRIYPSINPKKLFRMADFTRWGAAITKALGRTEEEFISAYEEKVRTQIEEAALDSPVATVLLDYMQHRKEWEGTPSQLYISLVEHAKDLGISRRQKHWPKAPNALTRQLNELAPSLKALGLRCETGIRAGSEGTRRIRLKTVSTVRTVSEYGNQHEEADDTDDTDDISPTSSRGMMDSFFLTCFLCKQPIHTKAEAYTFEEGKPCHTRCLKSHRR